MANLLDKLFKDFNTLLESDSDQDVILKIGKYPDQKNFKAHSLILNIRSSHFRLEISKSLLDNKPITIEEQNISPNVFEIILRYLYTGIINLDELLLMDTIDLLSAAHDLSLNELSTYIQEFLIEKKTRWLRESFVVILNTYFQQESYPKLARFCEKHIISNALEILTSEDLNFLNREVLKLVLKADFLAGEISEVEIWMKLVKWGISNALPTDISCDILNMNSSQIESLKEALNELIPLVRLFHITPEEYYQFIHPHKKILPKELKKDLIGYYISNQRTRSPIIPPRVCSVTLTFEAALIIKNWIKSNADQLSSPDIDILDEHNGRMGWKLIHRASRDGHLLSDSLSKYNNSSFVIAIKIKDQQVIVGGYNPLMWYENNNLFVENVRTKESFIFQLDTLELKKSKICRVRKDKYSSITKTLSSFATEVLSRHLPVQDLIIRRNPEFKYYCKTGGTYEDGINVGNFYAEDYEVFQVCAN
ncbi:5304_t:CDS:2 [Acaulospora colombiana]|uniref:5304_t:CDS:1 n=1 Tax=Acaulospora colombiana TaxID=27376 RepID=A0ACA9NQV6_9GLOM|nr:5304_t:CDS:2 [Acaulospora colombiana]